MVADLRVAVIEARAIAAGDERTASAGIPGTLTRLGPDLALVTEDGTLDLVLVQPSGGRPMSGADLLRGRPELVGSSVAAPPPGVVDLGPLERPVR